MSVSCKLPGNSRHLLRVKTSRYFSSMTNMFLPPAAVREMFSSWHTMLIFLCGVGVTQPAEPPQRHPEADSAKQTGSGKQHACFHEHSSHGLLTGIWILKCGFWSVEAARIDGAIRRERTTRRRRRERKEGKSWWRGEGWQQPCKLRYYLIALIFQRLVSDS